MTVNATPAFPVGAGCEARIGPPLGAPVTMHRQYRPATLHPCSTRRLLLHAVAVVLAMLLSGRLLGLD
jgi:hypothetical protein